MSAAPARIARGAALGALVLAWAAAAHYTTALVESSAWGAALGMAPFVAIAAAFAWRSARRIEMLALLAAGAGGLAFAWPRLAQNVGWMYFVQHVGTNALLGLAFGRTLLGGRQPLCSRLAALVHGRLSPALARYTHRVTVAWTAFFAMMASTSVLLFAFAPIAVWSAFANLLALPLVGLMFVAEYAVRLRVLPPEDRGGILESIRAYRASCASPEMSGEVRTTPAER